jgi:hypothetical protein
MAIFQNRLLGLHTRRLRIGLLLLITFVGGCAIVSRALAAINNWQTGQLIPGTEAIAPGRASI